MILSPRYMIKDGKQFMRGVVLEVENEQESLILDKVFGNKVGKDGLIGTKLAECRLSDGYGKHYIYIKTKKTARKK